MMTADIAHVGTKGCESIARERWCCSERGCEMDVVVVQDKESLEALLMRS